MPTVRTEEKPLVMRPMDAQPAALRHIPEIDGLRAIAVLAVLVYHLRGSWSQRLLPATGIGWIGVDLFFVISGFLITRILLESRERDDYFRGFYTRRIRRIWPLYYCVVAFALLGSVLHAHVVPGAWAYLVFVQNLAVPGFGVYALAPTWSLAIEEQFYALWPLVVRHTSETVLRRGLVVTLIVSPLLRAWLLYTGHAFHMVYVGTPFRLDGLAAGALIAILSRHPKALASMRRWSGAIFAAGIAASIPLIRITGVETQTSALLFTCLAAGFAGMVAACATGASWTRALRSGALGAVGRISFGLYVLQFPVFKAVEVACSRMHRTLPNWELVLLKIALLFAAAAISWRRLEEPLLRRRKPQALQIAAHA
jgi:peptidoglycan/LPS O-acetylase OafA/YrhL